jgi:hypothetical protein
MSVSQFQNTAGHFLTNGDCIEEMGATHSLC